ncbi:MAG: hypothetical protein ABI165_02050 [Bryobacteraceae bacterium]
MVFDAPLANYRSRVTNAADPSEEEFSYMNLPLRLDSETVRPAEN